MPNLLIGIALAVLIWPTLLVISVMDSADSPTTWVPKNPADYDHHPANPQLFSGSMDT